MRVVALFASRAAGGGTLRRIDLRAALSAAGLATASACVAADEAEPKRPELASWIVTVGGTPSVEPRFVGGKVYGPAGLPQISFRRSDDTDEFSAPEDGLDYVLLGDATWAVGPVANLRNARYGSMDRQLTGLRSYPIAVDVGMFAQVWLVPEHLRARLEVRQGLRDRDGIVADVFVDAVRKVGLYTVSFGPRLSWGDAPANRLEFGVNGRDVVLNGVPVYRPGAGLRSVGITGAVSYDWSPEWRTTAYQRYDRLTGEAAASPIPRRYGSLDQFTLGLGIYYSFDTRAFP